MLFHEQETNNFYYVNNIVTKLKKAKKIAIFGAGIVAVEVSSCLMGAPYHLEISCFIVSQLENNPSKLWGRKVISLYEASNILPCDTLIVIACMEKNLDSIVERLHQSGFYNLLPLTFESDLWSLIRGNYFIEYCHRNQKKYLILEEELKNIDYYEKRNEVSIYTAKCHVDKPLKKDVSGYSWEIPIQVGSELTSNVICDIQDNTGDNISNKNRTYCELTALYWIWKNTSSEYVGLCHYRRHFELDEQKLKQLSNSNIDVVLTIPILNFPSVKEVYGHDHVLDDWEIMIEGIQKLSPAYMEAAVLVQESIYYYGYNMFIARKSIFDDYCSWLFPILFYCENHCMPKENSYQNRYIGFLAERLLTIYMKYHEDDYKIVHARKHFIER